MSWPVNWSLVLVGAVAVGMLVTAPAAHAQGSVSFTPWGGIYVPTRNAFSTLGTDIKRSNSFVGGARLTVWGRSLFGVELSAGLAPARTTIAGATLNGSRNTNVFLGSVKLAIGISPASSPVGFSIGLGPAVIRRGHDLFRQDQSVTDLGGVIGAGVRVPLASHVGLRLDAEDYLYGGDFDGSRKFQNDLVLSVGLSLAF